MHSPDLRSHQKSDRKTDAITHTTYGTGRAMPPHLGFARSRLRRPDSEMRDPRRRNPYKFFEINEMNFSFFVLSLKSSHYLSFFRFRSFNFCRIRAAAERNERAQLHLSHRATRVLYPAQRPHQTAARDSGQSATAQCAPRSAP